MEQEIGCFFISLILQISQISNVSINFKIIFARRKQTFFYIKVVMHSKQIFALLWSLCLPITPRELSNLLAIMFLNSKTAGNVTLVRTKLTYVINYGFQKYLLENCMGQVKNTNHFTVCFNKLLNYLFVLSLSSCYLYFLLEAVLFLSFMVPAILD